MNSLRLATSLVALALLAQPGMANPSASPPAAVQTDSGSALVARWSDAWNRHDAVALAKLFAADAVYEDFAFQARFDGRDSVAVWVGITSQSIPDASIEVTEAFQAGDRVAIRWRFKGTPRSLGPVPGTGRSFDLPAVTVLELRGGMIAREQDFYNLADLERQIGVPSGAYAPMPALATP